MHCREKRILTSYEMPSLEERSARAVIIMKEKRKELHTSNSIDPDLCEEIDTLLHFPH